MRAKEFVVKIPVAVSIDDGGNTSYRVMPIERPEEHQDVMMTPQQQELELQKAALGKESPAADQLLDDAEDDEIS